MSEFDSKKLTVEFNEVTTTSPMIPRRYTLTHSDITGNLYLMIGLEFAYERLSSNRDEVLGEWVMLQDEYIYNVYLYVDGYDDPKKTTIRNLIFRRELPLALEAIKYGDKEFLKTYNELNTAPILVYFISQNPEYNRIENWGSFSDY